MRLVSTGTVPIFFSRNGKRRGFKNKTQGKIDNKLKGKEMKENGKTSSRVGGKRGMRNFTDRPANTKKIYIDHTDRTANTTA